MVALPRSRRSGARPPSCGLPLAPVAVMDGAGEQSAVSAEPLTLTLRIRVDPLGATHSHGPSATAVKLTLVAPLDADGFGLGRGSGRDLGEGESGREAVQGGADRNHHRHRSGGAAHRSDQDVLLQVWVKAGRGEATVTVAGVVPRAAEFDRALLAGLGNGDGEVQLVGGIGAAAAPDSAGSTGDLPAGN